MPRFIYFVLFIVRLRESESDASLLFSPDYLFLWISRFFSFFPVGTRLLNNITN